MARIFIGSAIAIVGLSAAFIACQPSETEKPLPGETEATAGQTSAFDNSVKSIGRVENVVSMLKNPEVSAQDALAEQMKQALVAGNCVITSETTQPNTTETITVLKVEGATCPMTANYKKHIVKNGKVTIVIAFQITEPSLKKLNDIYNLNVSGEGTMASDTDDDNLNFMLTGEALSATRGKVYVTLHHMMKTHALGSDVTQSGFQQIAFQFSEFKVVVKADVRVINSVDYSSYTINNKAITQEEYLGYAKPLGIILN